MTVSPCCRLSDDTVFAPFEELILTTSFPLSLPPSSSLSPPSPPIPLTISLLHPAFSSSPSEGKWKHYPVMITAYSYFFG